VRGVHLYTLPTLGLSQLTVKEHLAIWLDGEDVSTILLSGDKVVQWRDKSGNNRHLYQSVDGNRPTYDSVNNRLVFDSGSDTFLRSLDWTISQPFTIYIKLEWEGVVSAVQWAIDVLNTDPGRIAFYATSTNIKLGAPNTGSLGTFDQDEHVLGLSLDGANSVAFMDYDETAWDTQSVAQRGISLGIGNDDTYPFNGYIKEIFFYSEAHDLATRNAVRTWLGFEGSSFCAEYQAIYDSWTEKPSDAVAANMNTLVEADVNDGLWAKYDVRYVTAVHTNVNGEAHTNWKNPGTYDLTLVNAPAFVAFEGFTGDGSSYTDTNFNPFSDGVNYTQDDAGFGGYLRKDVAEMSYMMGIEDATKDCYILPRYTSDFAYAKINANIQTAGGVNVDARGMYFANRDAANNQDLWKSKVKIVDDNDASSGVPNFTFYLLAWNNGNVAQNFSTNQIAEARISSSFSDAEIANCTDNFETYMDSNGKGVIT